MKEIGPTGPPVPSALLGSANVIFRILLLCSTFKETSVKNSFCLLSVNNHHQTVVTMEITRGN